MSNIALGHQKAAFFSFFFFQSPLFGRLLYISFLIHNIRIITWFNFLGRRLMSAFCWLAQKSHKYKSLSTAHTAALLPQTPRALAEINRSSRNAQEICVGWDRSWVFWWWILKHCCSGVATAKCMIIDRCIWICPENSATSGSRAQMTSIIWCNSLCLMGLMALESKQPRAALRTEQGLCTGWKSKGRQNWLFLQNNHLKIKLLN